MSADLERAVVFFVALVVAVIIHEVAHGVVALWFGDDTAKRAGRITLNPVPHIDPFGSIVLPAMGAFFNLPVLAWAKPVPVNPAQLRNPRRDMVFVSLAGPAVNFLLAIGAAVAARVLFAHMVLPPNAYRLTDLSLGFQLVFSFALVNLFLGVFNLLPIPPLDGSALLERALPAHWLATYHRIRPYGFLILFGLVFWTGIIGSVLRPVETTLIEFVVG